MFQYEELIGEKVVVKQQLDSRPKSFRTWANDRKWVLEEVTENSVTIKPHGKLPVVIKDLGFGLQVLRASATVK